jgi:hypothetical protein
MKYIIIILLLPFIKFTKLNEAILNESHAMTPSFTKSADGKVYLSWIESEKKGINKPKISFFYSTFEDNTFSKKIRVPIVDSAATHAEGMPRLAIKKDGSMIVTFELKKSNPTSRFGADLLYIFSKDGLTWSKPTYVQTDRDPTKSHSFSKPIRIANGEIGVVWLDEKLTTKGRSVKFSKTSKDKGFGKEILIDNQACECCRIEAITDEKGGLYIFYRDLYEDGSRDMSYVYSKDNGKSFSKAQNVYVDKWQVNACPHSGPSATANNDQILMAWFTGKEDAAGIKVCDVNTGKIVFSEFSEKLKNPQITSIDQGNPYLVYTESKKAGENFYSSIELRNINKKDQSKTITKNLEDCSYPAISSFKNDLLLAYIRNIDDQHSEIAWQKVKPF